MGAGRTPGCPVVPGCLLDFLRTGNCLGEETDAVRLGWTARALCRESFDRVSFGLHGSFARTYRGHGTDLALLAGVIGMQPDDERIRDAADIAASKGLTFTFYETELDHVHENAVKIELFRGDVCLLSMTGSSVGGGRIMVNTLNGVRIGLNTELPAMIIRHRDVRGMIRNIAAVLADEQMNIGTLRLSRDSGGNGLCGSSVSAGRVS